VDLKDKDSVNSWSHVIVHTLLRL